MPTATISGATSSFNSIPSAGDSKLPPVVLLLLLLLLLQPLLMLPSTPPQATSPCPILLQPNLGVFIRLNQGRRASAHNESISRAISRDTKWLCGRTVLHSRKCFKGHVSAHMNVI
jgi:hypothetical protein